MTPLLHTRAYRAPIHSLELQERYRQLEQEYTQGLSFLNRSHHIEVKAQKKLTDGEYRTIIARQRIKTELAEMSQNMRDIQQQLDKK